MFVFQIKFGLELVLQNNRFQHCLYLSEFTKPFEIYLKSCYNHQSYRHRYDIGNKNRKKLPGTFGKLSVYRNNLFKNRNRNYGSEKIIKIVSRNRAKYPIAIVEHFVLQTYTKI